MLKSVAPYTMYDLGRLDRAIRLADALGFFICDTIKMFLLLTVILFIVSGIRSFFRPEKAERILSHKNEFIVNMLTESWQ